MPKIGGHLVYNGQLYVSGYSYYDGRHPGRLAFCPALELDDSRAGARSFSSWHARAGFVSGYMTLIPSEWQSALRWSGLDRELLSLRYQPHLLRPGGLCLRSGGGGRHHAGAR
jgi:hypothetical protein